MEEHEASVRHVSLTLAISESPYHTAKYLERADFYIELGFHDLAAGDAYKALLLTDELRDDCGEYHSQACSASLTGLSDSAAQDEILHLALSAYRALAKALSQCGCLRGAYDFICRGLLLKPEDHELLNIRERLLPSSTDASSAAGATGLDDLPRRSLVPAMLYPWNNHEPDRFTTESLDRLNYAIAKVAPKLEARSTDLPILSTDAIALGSVGRPSTIRQLGLFAKTDIEPGELVLQERSLLAVCLPSDKPLCDCCGAELPVAASPSLGSLSRGDEGYTCADCDDAVFCSEACQILASETYHPIVCDRLVESVARERPPAEAADALYLLLLTRAIALAEARQVHLLDLEEVRYLWGDFMPERLPSRAFGKSGKLPFSFEYNILYPLNILEKMDIDIFATGEQYSTWILNTVYAKFRAVANGSMNAQTGRPEVCAIHPLWCLANHSCSPNVKWAWGGEIKLWARKDEEVVAWGDGSCALRKGVKEGEEILNHYCDLELDVDTRREWMMGSLGGICMCERCMLECSKEKAMDPRPDDDT